MIPLLLLSILWFFGYSGYLKIRHNVASISESYYKLGGSWFLWWTEILGLTLLPILVHLSPDIPLKTLAFISVCLLGLIPVFPNYLGKHRIPHFILAVLSGLSSVIWSIAVGYWYIPIISLAIALGLSWKRKDILFWIEIAGLSAVYMGIILKFV